jgi:hypothetical protein
MGLLLIQDDQVVGTWLFLGVCGLTFHIIRHHSGQMTSNRKFISMVTVTVACFATLLRYCSTSWGPNFYAELGVKKSDKTLNIRKKFRSMTADLSLSRFESSEDNDEFMRLKNMYDTVMDEERRAVYDRFGPVADNDGNDPRKNELEVISKMLLNYIFWGFNAMLITQPNSSRAARSWIPLLLVVALLTEVFFGLTETSLPNWVPFPTLTEFEFVRYCHFMLALAFPLLAALAEKTFTDPDSALLEALVIADEQKKAYAVILTRLRQLTPIIGTDGETLVPPPDAPSLGDRPSRAELSDEIREATETMQNAVDRVLFLSNKLKNMKGSRLSGYSWIIFVVLYLGVYLV